MSRATMTPSTQPQGTKMPQAAQPTYEQIAKRAYEKWLKRGRPNGTSMQDWLEAEAELRKEFGTTSGYRS